ncbi:MAG TPA: PEP/pyruvate-binding domain-containing protein [bacterium]|nr:PEP/pyruvate-binding domain-containing protein [bacterium]HPS30543.1 PEP/pyruvate-binding domain-containing protein [bacterium]
MKYLSFFFISGLVFLILSCGDGSKNTGNDDEQIVLTEGKCVVASEETEYSRTIGCKNDFTNLSSEPMDSLVSGAMSAKVVFDTADNDALYFQNTKLFQIHYDFVSTHLSGNGLPVVPDLASFNTTEYFSPERRFILGAISFYEGPQIWALEFSPYDTASSEMISKLYYAVQKNSYFGPALYFHPTSDAITVEAAKLPDDIKIVTTDEIYAGTDYQPLTVGIGVGQLKFMNAADLSVEYVSYKDIVILDEAPNDISVVQGLITEEFQTPLSHVNVLSQNRGTPNMGLKGAMTNEKLRALEGKIVQLTVSADKWSVKEVTTATAEKFWAEHLPEPVVLPPVNLDPSEIVNVEDVTEEPAEGEMLIDKIKEAINAYGGKAAQYSLLTKIDGVPVKKAFAVPMYFYYQFMEDNGFFDEIDGFLTDDSFNTDSATRARKLTVLREEMMEAPVSEEFQTKLKAKIEADFNSGSKLRFRTSTNSEDLYGFACAGCYESHSGDPADWDDVLDAIKESFTSAWLYRTFEERSYYGVDHKSVGMALLVHYNFPDEEANGVAVTNNPFDSTGLDPAFYVNVQYGGDIEVVAPPAGVYSDQFLYYFSQPNQPISYISHSNLITEGTTVLTKKQIYQLGTALDAIHNYFSAAYGPASGSSDWYAMDVEFKFDDDENPGEVPALYIKQARPYPGKGM